MKYKEKIELIKSLSSEPETINDEQASLAYDRLVQLYTLLIKAKIEIDNNMFKENEYVKEEKQVELNTKGTKQI